VKRFGGEATALVLLLAVIVAISLVSTSSPPSTFSSFDAGRNGYLALYDVLARTGVPVSRLEAPLGELPKITRVLVVTAVTPPIFGTQFPMRFAPGDLKRVRAFLARGGTLLVFGRIADLSTTKGVRIFPVADYTNEALNRHPANAVAVYDAVAGRGAVAFDEQIHGYDRTRSLWSVLPAPVRAACWIALAALVLWLVDANVRFTPAVSVEPPADRDSSDYVISMARLLRRARAGAAAIARFAAAYPRDAELAALAAQADPNPAAVRAAAARYTTLRKERHDR
jgi:hypothetical protein